MDIPLSEVAAMYHELRKRGTSVRALGKLPTSAGGIRRAWRCALTALGCARRRRTAGASTLASWTCRTRDGRFRLIPDARGHTAASARRTGRSGAALRARARDREAKPERTVFPGDDPLPGGRPR